MFNYNKKQLESTSATIASPGISSTAIPATTICTTKIAATVTSTEVTVASIHQVHRVVDSGCATCEVSGRCIQFSGRSSTIISRFSMRPSVPAHERNDAEYKCYKNGAYEPLENLAVSCLHLFKRVKQSTRTLDNQTLIGTWRPITINIGFI